MDLAITKQLVVVYEYRLDMTPADEQEVNVLMVEQRMQERGAGKLVSMRLETVDN